MAQNPLRTRTIATADDLSLDEMLYLFENTASLKKAIKEQDQHTLDSMRLKDTMTGVYTLMLEDSTRTRESFRNAALFHDVKYSVFDADHSSINKKESYADTINNLIGYDNAIFIIRSKLEGVCRWLERSGEAYAERHGMPKPSFINAGDGKHEHPTQELLDEYTFWEDNGTDTSHIHVALIGDLLHGRTVHSKADGLRVFDEVKVDLIAPDDIAMPRHYIRKMRDNGFEVREFGSIREYLDSQDMADKWYFTRPQLERMGEEVRRRQQKLREDITFSRELFDSHAARMPAGTRFYHPLPRHKEQPTIPRFLDETELNGYERQSQNGYFTRAVLLAAIGGGLKTEFTGEPKRSKEYPDDFITRIDAPPMSTKKEYTEGIRPISDGVVIDHICRGESYEDIENHSSMIVNVLNLYGRGGRWADESFSEKGVYKGIISRPGMEEPDERDLRKLAALAPGCTVNIIEDNTVSRKYRLQMPPRIFGFERISCKNDACISSREVNEGVETEFHRYDDFFVCVYCDTAHSYKQIWGT